MKIHRCRSVMIVRLGGFPCLFALLKKKNPEMLVLKLVFYVFIKGKTYLLLNVPPQMLALVRLHQSCETVVNIP
jgi:hypothetical protein